MQQDVANLTVSHLKQANASLSVLKSLDASLLLQFPQAPSTLQQLSHFTVLSFSDASTGKGTYGQSGSVIGLYFTSADQSIYHILDWHSAKQTRVSFSSPGAEILAAAETVDRCLLLSGCLASLRDKPIPLVLTVDSYGLYSTITTLHEGGHYRLRPVVARLRDSFESREVSVLQWIPWCKTLADGLTKVNPHSFKLLNTISITGRISSDIFASSERKL